MTARAPRRSPGKKPAAKDLGSKEEVGLGSGDSACEDEEEVWETEAGDVGVEEAVGGMLGGVLTEMHIPELQV